MRGLGALSEGVKERENEGVSDEGREGEGVRARE